MKNPTKKEAMMAAKKKHPLTKPEEHKKLPLVIDYLQLAVDRIILGEVKKAGSPYDNWWNKGLHKSTHILQTRIDKIEELRNKNLVIPPADPHLLGVEVINIEAEKMIPPKSSGEAKYNFALDRSVAIINNLIREIKKADLEKVRGNKEVVKSPN